MGLEPGTPVLPLDHTNPLLLHGWSSDQIYYFPGEVWKNHTKGKKHRERLSLLDAENGGPESEPEASASSSRTPECSTHTQWHKHLLKSLHDTQSVDEQIYLLSSLQQFTEADIQTRCVMVAVLQMLFRLVFPSCCLTQFGSSVNNFGARGSDLDLVLFPSGLTDGERERFKMADLTEESQALKNKKLKGVLKGAELRLASLVSEVNELGLSNITTERMVSISTTIISNNKLKVSDICPLPGASVPIVKFSFMGVKCDMSFNNRIVLYNSALLNHCCLMDERIRPLVVTLCYWARCHGIRPGWDGRGGHCLTTYCLTWMVFHYLQTENILPSVEEMIDLCAASDLETVDGCQCMALSYTKKPTQQRQHNNNNSPTQLLRNFFKYYSEIDHSSTAVCPRSGRLQTLAETWGDDVETDQSPMLKVQDPYELSRNIAKNVNAAVAERFRQTLKESVEMTDDVNFTVRTEGEPYGLETLLDAGNKISEETRGKRRYHYPLEPRKITKL